MCSAGRPFQDPLSLADDLGNAVECGNMELVLELLGKGANVNINALSGPPPLISAVCGGHIAILKLLLDRGADINSRFMDATALMLAVVASGNDVETINFLLDRGANINTVVLNHGTALSVAAYLGKHRAVSLLLDRGAEINTVGGDYGTALAAAAYMGNDTIISLLLDRGAEINTVGGDYGTALVAAAYGGYSKTINLLLDRGAEINLSRDRGAEINTVGGDYGTALAAAAYTGNDTIISLLLDRGAEINTVGGDYGTALAAAAYGGYSETINLLLARGAEINTVGDGYGTALTAAVYKGNDRIISLLLDRGAEINTVGGDYGTALAAAAYSGNGEAIQLLLNRGAEINTVGGYLGTALASAAYKENERIASLLLARGAQINTVGGDYGTALAAAAYTGNCFIIELLLDRGAEINTVCGDYGTALAAAAYSGNEEATRFLLNRGAEINRVAISAKHGVTPLAAAISQSRARDCAYSAARDDIVRELLYRGADINSVGDEYGTPLGKAAYHGDAEFVLCLIDHGADSFHVGGSKYRTEQSGYPTALDAAKAGTASEDLVKFLSDTMVNHSTVNTDSIIWPPFPMPTIESPPFAPADDDHIPYNLESILEPNQCAAHDGRTAWLTPEQADLPCKALDQAQVLISVLKTLVGISADAAQRYEPLIQNDTQFFIAQSYDLGLAYSAARIAWKDFNDLNEASTAVHRQRWLINASEYMRGRRKAICNDETSGNQVIVSPYQVMPRRMWDIRSNRVIDYGMIHTSFCTLNEEHLKNFSFWAITHSWTNNMNPIKTTINGSDWPVPLPNGLNLENDVRKELLNYGAEYVWLDVLCLRQESTVDFHADYIERNRIKEEEWKLDVPTIGNIYRSASAVVRYFNGLGVPFSNTGSDDPRHWLQRAWTLQEIKDENITINGGFGTRLLSLRSRSPTIADALRPILRLAAQVDSPNGCSMYELAREMARRHATQPNDKVSGLLYLLRAINLPTYREKATEEDAWTECFPVLPLGRKMELLFDFPYRAGSLCTCTSNTKAKGCFPTLTRGLGLVESPRNVIRDRGDCLRCLSSKKTEQRWFPTWVQLLNWPDRDPDYDHTVPISPHAQAQELLQLPPGNYPNSLFITNLWGISQVSLCTTSDCEEYELTLEGQNIGFFWPYRCPSPINIQKSQLFTLVTPYPQVTGNWAVCELVEVGEWKQVKGGKSSNIKYEVLRKVGVLRTDSCSVLFVGAETGSKTLLKKLNVLFI